MKRLPARIPHACRALPVLVALAALSGCFVLRSSDGGGETRFDAPREVDASDVALQEGYRIEVVATELEMPTGVAFDDRGRVYVTEAGYSYGEVIRTPRLVRIEPDGRRTVVAEGTNPPWNGVVYHDGAFYVAGGHLEPGQILRITLDGSVTPVVEGLPSMGDHHTNGPAVGSDGWIYFGQGTATNAAVVGSDNYDFGWPARYADFHDVPCRDVVLAGRNFRTPDLRNPEARGTTLTGAYVPFGTRTERGQVVEGRVPCTGAVLRVRPEGGAPELVAWGLRNPFGLAFSPDGGLYVTENQFDVRGSRPVFGTGDLLWRIEEGRWYGWPDYFAGRPLTDDRFEAPGEDQPQLLLLEHPEDPPEPAAILGVHSSSNGLDFSSSDAFGYRGEAFIAQFGDMAPGVGKVLAPVGYKVIRVDVETGVVQDFIANRGERNGPASRLGSGGLERPVSVRFDPSGEALYVVDFGVMTTQDGDVRPRPGTGVLWRVTRTGR